MVRSIKSGLPLNDAIRMISAEGQEPVRTEFKRIVEAQQMGMNVAGGMRQALQQDSIV
jgi:tight adherence protein B